MGCEHALDEWLELDVSMVQLGGHWTLKLNLVGLEVVLFRLLLLLSRFGGAAGFIIVTSALDMCDSTK